jgi:uncharacterized MAPEG superfamily protein
MNLDYQARSWLTFVVSMAADVISLAILVTLTVLLAPKTGDGKKLFQAGAGTMIASQVIGLITLIIDRTPLPDLVWGHGEGALAALLATRTVLSLAWLAGLVMIAAAAAKAAGPLSTPPPTAG